MSLRSTTIWGARCMTMFPNPPGDVGGALQDAVKRISAESGAARGSGSNCEADGTIFLWRRLGSAQGICAAGAEVVFRNCELSCEFKSCDLRSPREVDPTRGLLFTFLVEQRCTLGWRLCRASQAPCQS